MRTTRIYFNIQMMVNYLLLECKMELLKSGVVLPGNLLKISTTTKII
jgi:hypothetical protein